MLEVTLFGQFAVAHDGQRLSVPTRNAQALFAYLILTAGQTHRRERLAGLLWPDSLEESARANLRHELWRLRKALEPAGPAALLVDDLGIGFNPAIDYILDARTLETAPVEGSTAETLAAAIAVYAGELLPGFYQEWVFAERERLRLAYEARMGRLLEVLQEQGRWSEVLEWSTRWITAGGWPESAYRALITAYANLGDTSNAAAAYDRFSQGLQKELGLKPSEQTQALHQRLQAGWGAPAATPAVTAAPTAAGPAPVAPRVFRSNLPRPLTSFIGREAEIDHLRDLLTTARLVTLVGPGGVGKTRLAIEVSRAVGAGFADGAWWVELAALADGAARAGDSSAGPGAVPGEDLVGQAVAKALRVSEAPGHLLMDDVLEHVRDRQLLLVLDNCEHLVDACAVVVERLLVEGPGLTVVVTSREPLRVAGEKVWNLMPLSLPQASALADVSTLARSEAVRLFAERAADTLPGYRPSDTELSFIAQICLRLDGIPLAIELAAARTALLSVEEIAVRLDSRFSLLTGGRRTALARHQTLEAAIDWSHDLLSEAEKTLFRRLSVFAGSFTLEAAESVCAGEDLPREAILSLLGRLVDKSLVHAGHSRPDPGLASRFQLLDTICTFGYLKLAEKDEVQTLRDSHALYYRRLAEEAEPRLLLQDQIPWSSRLQVEHDNLRAAIDWSIESNQAESAMRLVSGLTWSWFSFGSMREGAELAERALAIPSTADFPAYRAKTLNTVGYLRFLMGETDAIRGHVDEALAILEDSNDEPVLIWTLSLLAFLQTADGRDDLADAAIGGLSDLSNRLRDYRARGMTLAFRGDIAVRQGDLERARAVYEESAAALLQPGDRNFYAYVMRRLGYLALARGDVKRAGSYFRSSLAFNREVGEKRGVVASLLSLATLAAATEQPLPAARLYGAVERRMEIYSTLLYLDQVELGRVRGRLVATLDEAAYAAAFAAGWELTEAEVMELVTATFGETSAET